ncbi:MAG: hypothetical protein F4X99_01790 [Gammaproteobacteria bacterium]|nr:hypothetical protein [Gammaproteobacteria bacterium]
MKYWVLVALLVALAGCVTPPASQGAYVTLVRDAMAESAERAEASENPERAVRAVRDWRVPEDD